MDRMGISRFGIPDDAPVGARSRARPEDDGGLQARWLLVLLPLSQCVAIPAIGQLLLSDILAVGCAAVLLLTRGLPRDPEPRLLAGALGLWLAGAVATDLWVGSVAADYLRGWLRIVTFGSYLLALVMLIGRRPDRAALWALGYGLGTLLRFVVSPNEQWIESPFKFGLGFASYCVVLAALPALLPRFATRIVPSVLLLLAMAFVALRYDTRSLFALLAAAAILTGANLFFANRPWLVRPGPRGLLATGLVCAAALWAAMALYGQLAASGSLGDAQREKYLQQTAGDVSLLASGRNETLASLQAVADSPVVGHGSWARDMRYVTLKVLRMEQAGLLPFGDPFEDDLIPTHSVIINAWVENGILALPFWIAALAILGRFGLGFLRVRSRFVALFAMCLLTFAWDALFSPLSVGVRIAGPMALAIACATLAAWRAERAVAGQAGADGRRIARGRPAFAGRAG